MVCISHHLNASFLDAGLKLRLKCVFPQVVLCQFAQKDLKSAGMHIEDFFHHYETLHEQDNLGD